MGSLQQRFESWIRDQSGKIRVSWPQLSWPWKSEREERKRLQEEYERRRKQLHDLCHSVKADSVSDLRDILCSMVLSECVYKRPAAEMVRAVNKFKADFGGQIISLERVQLSLDHVPHRYLLAEAGDTLFASFIGTKQYKDVIADANILQGAIFHEDFTEGIEENGVIKSDQVDCQNKRGENLGKPLQPQPNDLKDKSKPAAHRGFLARAKGIPALELYRLAQKKNQKLVLCGHSLGGAVAALATLAILRVIASSSPSKENEKVPVKCITFSQPPVGNASLRDYVHRKGWQHYFKTYCIPEDVVPRILSPAYFHHYTSQPLQTPIDVTGESSVKPKYEAGRSRVIKRKGNDGEQLVLGVGPVQNSIWRLSRLVPLEGVRKQLDRFKRTRDESGETSSAADSGLTSTLDEVEAVPQSLEIQEGSDGISLTPLSDTDRSSLDDSNSSSIAGKSNSKSLDSRRWGRVPYLPSYVPFGQLYLLGNSLVESLSDAEYSKLTSVRSVIAELRERFQSHSMKSYRSRFQKIYDLCMYVNASPFLGIEQLPQFPHLQQWLGLAVAGTVELGDIVEPPVIRTATSIIPLGWSGVPGEKTGEPLKVDITGYGLHLCSLVQAQVNGNWCSTIVESLPSKPPYPSYRGIQPDLQKMRVLIGAPLKQPPKNNDGMDSLNSSFLSQASDTVNPSQQYNIRLFCEGESIQTEGLRGFYICCSSDFVTVSKEVYVRTRRVRLVGLEGAGKTSLFNAILGKCRLATPISLETMYPDMNAQEGIAGGLCYIDSVGVNLQELHLEATRFRDELWMGVRDLSKKTDLIILVHNLSHKIPTYLQSNVSQQKPALSLLLNEAKSLGIPWLLTITNKFSVSAHQQISAVNAVLQAYQASPSMTQVTNSCPYITPGGASAPQSWGSTDDNDSNGRAAAQRFLLAPINLVRMPFQKKEVVLPVEGVTALRQLIHRVLRSHEETSFQELVKERLLLESAREQARAAEASQDSQGKGNSITAAAVGASLGAGVGLVLAVVMGAASALRKP
ncbi:lipase class 3 family protein [Tasmannia lanceolata]|uniref:lipase class 3 family protein n=1 Tax=Tasmannia lanceolata TaxID=3420 RepID=UPI004064A987